MRKKKIRHLLGVSGGKDSTALAIYMRDKVPEMEYFFCDTGSELPETYEYLIKLEKYLGKKIQYLNPVRGFDFWLKYNGYYLPAANMRWCTVNLKLKPLEEFIGNDEAISYVGIRHDEDDRKGHLSSKKNIKSAYPFIEAKIDKAQVYRILEEAGVGLPKYYRWRTRSGCYFCFFQRKFEWVGLLENHPDLFERAKAYEKFDAKRGTRFTWNQNESLEELSHAERVQQIKEMYKKVLEKEKMHPVNKPLHQVFEDALDKESDIRPCQICQL